MLEINNRYVRTAPDDEEDVVMIKYEQDVKYHTHLMELGYKYTKVVVHDMKQSCESCSG